MTQEMEVKTYKNSQHSLTTQHRKHLPSPKVVQSRRPEIVPPKQRAKAKGKAHMKKPATAPVAKKPSVKTEDEESKAKKHKTQKSNLAEWAPKDEES